MDLRINATIGGSPHRLQFHSLNISQEFFQPTQLYLILGYDRHQSDSVVQKATETWHGNNLEIEISDLANSVGKKYSGIIANVKITDDEVHLISYSPDFLMKNARKYKGYADINVLGIVKDILDNYGFPDDVKSPTYSQNFKYFQQYNESDWDCMLRLAELDGCVFYDNGERFYYGDKPATGGKVVLREFELFDAYFDCSIQNTKFRGAPYNFQKNSDVGGTEFVAKPAPNPENTFSVKSFEKSKKVFGSDTDEFYNYTVNEKQQYEKHLNKKQLFGIGNMVKFYGKTNNHTVVVGKIINASKHNLLKEDMMIYKMNAKFEDNSYNCDFIALHKDAIIKPEVSSNAYMQVLQPAIVIDNIDPSKLGRVMIQFIWDYSSNSTTWARVLEAGAGFTDDGVSYGTHYTPRVGDYVLIGFEISNSSYPIVLGALYHSEHKPDFETENGTEEVMVVKTPLQSTIRVLDKKGTEEIVISMRDNKNIIRMELKKPQITIESVKGVINIKSKNINILADNKITMSCNDMEINVKNNMTTKVEGESKIEVGKNHKLDTGQNIEQAASMDIKTLAGKNILSSASMNNEIEATLKASVKGLQVESTASTMNVIKGAMVQIN